MSCATRCARVQEAGATVVGTSDHTVTHSLYILDPDGNEIELYVDVPGVRLEDGPVAGLQPHPPAGAVAVDRGPRHDRLTPSAAGCAPVRVTVQPASPANP